MVVAAEVIGGTGAGNDHLAPLGGEDKGEWVCICGQGNGTAHNSMGY